MKVSQIDYFLAQNKKGSRSAKCRKPKTRFFHDISPTGWKQPPNKDEPQKIKKNSDSVKNQAVRVAYNLICPTLSSGRNIDP